MNLVGVGVTKLHEGQQVIPITEFGSRNSNGSFQKYVCIEANFVWPVPDDMPDEAAAHFTVNPCTTYSILKDLQVPKGEYIVQSAAGSTLGKQVIWLAKHWGMGAYEVICSTNEDVVARVKEITRGKGAWGALDAVCGTMTATLASCVRNGGQVFLYGVLGGFSTTLNAMDLFRGVSVTGWVLYPRGIDSPDKFQTIAAEVAPPVRDGIIPVAEVEKYDLTDFKQAMAKAAESSRSGTILHVSA